MVYIPARPAPLAIALMTYQLHLHLAYTMQLLITNSDKLVERLESGEAHQLGMWVAN